MNAPGVPDYEVGVRDNPEKVATKVTVSPDGVYRIEYIYPGGSPRAGWPAEFSYSVRLITDDFSDDVRYLLVNLDGGRRRWIEPDSDLANWISVALITYLGQPLGSDAPEGPLS